MPRPNQPRAIASEQTVARRVAAEREERGMSYDGLASRMTAAGCAINASALYKIEKGSPPRRITVDELVAFSRVFETTVADLITSSETRVGERVRELVEEVHHAHSGLLLVEDAWFRACDQLAEFIVANPSEATSLRDAAVGAEQPWSLSSMIDSLGPEHPLTSKLADLNHG